MPRRPNVRDQVRTSHSAGHGHRKILANFFLRPKNDSMVGMPIFYWVVRQNFDRNFDSVDGTIRGMPRTFRVAGTGTQNPAKF